MSTNEKFELSYKSCSLVGDYTANKKEIDLFMLHGAGKSDRNRFLHIRDKLNDEGLSSLSFDFTGHGETGGELSCSSLKDRTEQACSVIDSFKGNDPISLVGNSMSGYTAVKLTEIYEVENLVLIVPAAYDRLAYELNFNRVFSNCIRKKKSYLDSDSWGILKNYRGNLLIVSAENDEVIPREIIDKLMSSAVNAKSRQLITVDDSPHGIMTYMKDNPEVMDEVVESICDMFMK
jgi:hypothetical protein